METARNQLAMIATMLRATGRQLVASTVAAPFDDDCRQQRKDALEQLANLADELDTIAGGRPDPAAPHSGVGS